MRNALKKFAALGIVAALSVSAIAPTAFAAPVGTRAAQLEKAFAGQIVDVQWRRNWWIPGAVIGGLAAGAIIAGGKVVLDPPEGLLDAAPAAGERL